MRKERFEPACTAEHDRYGRGSLTVWSGISVQKKTNLHIIENDTLKAQPYVTEGLDVYVRRYAGAIGTDFIFKDENDRAQWARVANEYLGTTSNVWTVPLDIQN